jgi:uncharacterized protein YeaO (DUF488 family)
MLQGPGNLGARGNALASVSHFLIVGGPATGRREARMEKVPAERVRLKRVYEPAADDDGTRVLVERLWPRGVHKEAVERWERDVAPSPELRKWYGHDPARWEEFRARYLAELRQREPDVEALRELARAGRLTLVFAARDPEHSSAAVLREVLLGSDSA